MLDKSELERFLEAQSADGRVDSEGRFTVSRQEALRKIASFQLPFSNAWAVKLVQAIVAGSQSSQIRVELGSKRIIFYFGAFDFHLDDIVNAFYNPKPSEDRSLAHLIYALRSIGLSNQWGFQVTLPGNDYSLIWDRYDFNRVESDESQTNACITIVPAVQKHSGSWIGGMAKAANLNADIFLTLQKYCYVCPLALSVDGRRIDALQRAPIQGWSTTSFPLALGAVDSPLESLRLPLGSYEEGVGEVGTTLVGGGGGGWEHLAINNMKSQSKITEAPLAYIFSVHLKTIDKKSESLDRGGEGPAMLYWVLDGVVIEELPLLAKKFFCSIGCFISAEGLETDLSGFSLMQSLEKEKRLTVAYGGAGQALSSLEHLNLLDLVSRSRTTQWATGGAFIAGGFAMLALSAPFGLFSMLVGTYFFINSGGKQKQQVTSFRESIRGLREAIFREASRRVGRIYP